MPNEPASTAWELLLEGSGFFEAQEKDVAPANNATNNVCTTFFFTIPPTESLPCVTIALWQAQLPQSACLWSQCERSPANSKACVLHRACETPSRFAGSAGYVRLHLHDSGATALR